MTAVESASTSKIPLDRSPALFSLVQRLADNKYWLGRRYAEWCTSAPTLESAVAASAMAQDEIGHARSHYPLFRQFVGHDVEPEDRASFHSMAALDRPFEGWFDFVTANFLIDTALTTMFEAAQQSRYVDLATRARRIVGEERIHWLHGQAWVKRLAHESPASNRKLRLTLAQTWPEVLMWFGREGDSEPAQLCESGIVDKSPDGLRADFLRRVHPALEQGGLLTSLTNDLEWDRWDSERYRLSSS